MSTERSLRPDDFQSDLVNYSCDDGQSSRPAELAQPIAPKANIKLVVSGRRSHRWSGAGENSLSINEGG
jgi:hypothetical protein